ncbi:MAG TPA: hypothetical protein VF544_18085 [Pyrinomonadaceae bacterium]
MLTPTRRRTLVFVLALLAMAALTTVSFARHSWRKYHWARTSNPFTIKLGNNLNSAWSSYLSTASSDWSQSSVLDTSVVAGQTSPSTCSPTAGRVEVCNSAYGSTGWLGVAQIWTSSSHITQGTVKLNDTYFSQARYNTPSWRRMVTCQEVGHTFGLDHQDENFNNTNLGTCMDYSNDPSGTAGTNGTLNNEHPNLHDYAQLESIYSHFDTSTTILQRGGQSAAAPGQQDKDPQWGRLVRTTNGGRTALFEHDLGNDRKVFTFVIWADPDHEENDDDEAGH